jgi:hypothetical protein
MPSKLQQPFLVGALSLAFALWFLAWQSHWFFHLLSMATLLGVGLVAVAAGFGWRRSPLPAVKVQSAPSAAAVKQVLGQTETLIEQLEAESSGSTACQSQLRTKVSQVAAGLERKEIHLAVVGGKAVGKTTLIEILKREFIPQLEQPCSLVEVPSLFVGSPTSVTQEELAQKSALQADLLLFLTQADLTQPEYNFIRELVAQNKRTLLVFNKQDQYLPAQRLVVLQQLQKSMQGLIPATEVLAIAAAPSPIKVRQHQADGSLKEWLESPQPQAGELIERLNQVVTQEVSQLVVQQTLQQALALQAEARLTLNQLRRERALPIIERFQWLAAATAFANPFPTLDLLAAAAITSQMILELGALYQQKFSLAQAQAIAGTLARLMLKLGLVEFSTQTLGSLLKGNSITFVAGGLIQGVSAAYLTRLAGLSLIEHFQTLSENPSSASPISPLLESLNQSLQRIFQQNQRADFLKSLIQQAIDRLRPQGSLPELVNAGPEMLSRTAPKVDFSLDCSVSDRLESSPTISA